MGTPKKIEPGDAARPTKRIPKSALLAGTALGLPLAAHADIVFNPTQVTISTDNSTDATYNLDMTGSDGTDFVFTASFSSTSISPFDSVTPQGNNGYVGVAFPSPDSIWAAPLAAGTPIGPTSAFFTTTPLTGLGKLQKKGKTWPNSPTQFAFLGVEFFIGSDLHYGWVNVSASDGAATITINGWGYESGANTTILAGAGEVPEPSFLPLLALGAAGLAAFRARRKRAA